MRAVFGFLSAITGVYSLLIFIRIIFSWFSGMVSGKPVELLSRLTDPYLDWFRRNMSLKIGFLDFSAVVAIVCLSMLQSLFYTLSVAESVTIGNILAIILVSIWSILSFIIGFFMIIIVLRAFAYLTNRNIYSTFWNAVDNIYKPISYRINRIIFGKKIGGYFKGMVISFLLLGLLLIGGRFLINIIADFLVNTFPL